MFKKYLLFLPLGASVIFFANFKKSRATQTPTALAIQTTYRQGLREYTDACRQMADAANRQDSSAAGIAAVRDIFQRCRANYKRIEFLLAHTEEAAAKTLLNGAPLPSLEPNTPNLSVLPPRGMQPIEEIVYAETLELGAPALLARLTTELAQNAREVAAQQLVYPLDDRQILESVRFGLLRTIAMGIVGFDTPGSGRAIDESALGMQAMWQAFQQYLPYARPRAVAAADSVALLFPAAIEYLQKNQHFESFDRAYFIRQFGNPLYGLTLRIHLATGVETINEVSRLEQPVNYFAQSPFGPDFLNPYFYTAISRRENTPAVLALGRTLFYDPILSDNARMACATCHQPERAFTDGQPKSLSSDGQGTVSRNAPTLLNAVYAERFFYDLRADRLEDQVEHVVYSFDEFHSDFEKITARLNSSTEYQQLFQAAFRRPADKYTLSAALASYVVSLQAMNSPFDRYLRGETAEIDPAAVRGFNLFMGKAVCGTCHFAPTYAGLVPPSFMENESEVIGVPTRPDTLNLTLDPDLGRYYGRLKEQAPHLRHSFKTTTVRNAALTAPYMHNGAYPTLASVVDFYNRGGGGGMGLDLPNQTLPFDHLSLTRAEQNDLITFMQALTDTVGTISRPTRLPQFEGKPEWNQRGY